MSQKVQIAVFVAELLAGLLFGWSYSQSSHQGGLAATDCNDLYRRRHRNRPNCMVVKMIVEP